MQTIFLCIGFFLQIALVWLDTSFKTIQKFYFELHNECIYFCLYYKEKDPDVIFLMIVMKVKKVIFN